MGSGDNTQGQGQPLVELPSPEMNYFIQNWLRNLPSSKMAYLENWQPNPQDVNYDIPLAYYNREQPLQGIQWGDVGPAGARWHGSSTTMSGQPLKQPWHPTEWRQEIMPLVMKFMQLGLPLPPGLQ